jgi:hypothetical protein
MEEAMSDKPAVHPVTTPAAELDTVMTSFGPMEKWRARALSIGWFSAITRADDTATVMSERERRRKEREKARADAEREERREARRREVTQFYDGLLARCDAMLERLEMLERREAQRKKVQQAMDEAERKFTVEEPGPEPGSLRH